MSEIAHVRAGVTGFLKDFAVAPETLVRSGDKLVVLDEPALEARIASLAWRVRELELKLARDRIADQALAEITRIELDMARARLEREQDRRARMVVVSQAEGRFVPIRPPGDLIGRHIREGELIGYVLPDQPREVRAVVPQEAIDRVRTRLSGIEVMPTERLGQRFASRLLREVPAGRFELPSSALGVMAGGPIVADPRDPDQQTALARVFQFDLEIPPEAGSEYFGGRVHVKFHHPPEPARIQIYRRVRQLFLAEFDA